MKRSKLLRLTVQLLIGIGITYLFIIQDYTLAPHPYFTWSGWLDPFLGLVGLLQKQWFFLLLLSLLTITLTYFIGRFFCGWLCPVGTVLDLSAIVKKWLPWPDFKPVQWIRQYLNYLRWIILGGVIGFTLFKYFIVLVMNPFVLWPREIYRITSGLIPWSLGVVVLLGLALFPRFWCRYLCPTGSLFNLLSRFGRKKYLNGEECKQCGICIRKCPMQNIKPDLQYGKDCLYCGECLRGCSSQSIGKQNAPANINESRREFLTAASVGLGALAVAAVNRTSLIKTVTTDPQRWPRLLRPPGALAEVALGSTCSRCGQCLQVCPVKVLVPAGLEAGVSGLWTPRFVPRKGRCVLCMACGQVCPTKALIPVPVESVRLGKSKIIQSKCLAWAKGTQCLLCVETCPKFAIKMDAQQHPVIDLNRCNGCGSCEAHCPVEGSAVLLTYEGETRRKS